MRYAASCLMAIGALVLADVVVTLVWQEPLTALLAHRAQHRLEGQLKALDRQPLDPVDRAGLASLTESRQRIAFLARALDRRTAHGHAVGRLEIPRLHASDVVVKGSETPDLRKGPGTYSDVPFPGVPGTAAIAGHRTTFGAWFRHVDRLRPGDGLTLKMPYATLRYRVETTRIVVPTDRSVLKRVGYDRLILSACDPPYSAAKRIVILARLVGEQPVAQH